MLQQSSNKAYSFLDHFSFREAALGKGNLLRESIYTGVNKLLYGELRGLIHMLPRDPSGLYKLAPRSNRPLLLNGMNMAGCRIGVDYGPVGRCLRADNLFTSTTEGSRRAEWCERALGVEPGKARISSMIRRWFLFLNNPSHAEIRGKLNPEFVAKKNAPCGHALMKRALDDTERDLEKDLESIASKGKECELISAVNRPFALKTIMRMFGFSMGDYDKLSLWSKLLAGAFYGDVSYPEFSGEIDKFCTFVEKEIGARMVDISAASPRHDLLTMLMMGMEVMGSTTTRINPNYKLTIDEIVDTVALLFLAGHETTMNLAGVTVRELLLKKNYKQKQAFLNDPKGLSLQVAIEAGRVNPSVPIVARTAIDDIEAPWNLHAQETVLLSLIGANRDPEIFGPDADEFNMYRDLDTNRPLTYSSGIHTCLGKDLALKEVSRIISCVFGMYPNVRFGCPEGDIRFLPTREIRALVGCPVYLF